MHLNSRYKFEGTGLGLGLCIKIVDRYNGYIYAKAKEDEDVCFYVVLPAEKTKRRYYAIWELDS